MRPRAQDDVDQSVGVGPDLGGVAANALMGPITIAPMGARHMLGDGGRTMRQGAAQMRRHTLAAQENLDGLQGDPCLDLLTHEAVGNAVVMFGDLDMIIEIDPTALPLGILVGLVRQRHERRTIEFVEQFAPASPPAPQWSIVQIDEKTADRLVESGEREETAVPQPRQNPSTDNLYSHFDFSFIPRAIRPCWQNCSSVMAGEIGIGAVDHRLVEARPRDARLEIVAHRLPGRAVSNSSGRKTRDNHAGISECTQRRVPRSRECAGHEKGRHDQTPI